MCGSDVLTKWSGEKTRIRFAGEQICPATDWYCMWFWLYRQVGPAHLHRGYDKVFSFGDLNQPNEKISNLRGFIFLSELWLDSNELEGLGLD